MGMFNMRKPRAYNHPYIYVDERKEKLKKIEERAKRELGMAEAEPYNPEHIRGAFVQETTHLKRRKEGGKKISVGLALVLIVFLLLVLRYLVTGNARF